MRKPIIPPETFELIPILFLRFAEVLQACELTVPELLTLMHLRTSGHIRNGRRIERRVDVAEFLGHVLIKNNSDAGISKFLDHMVEQKLIEKTSLTSKELKDWYDQEKGYKHGLIMTRRGDERLTTFEQEVNQRLMSKFPPPLRSAMTRVIPMATKFLRTEYGTSKTTAARNEPTK